MHDPTPNARSVSDRTETDDTSETTREALRTIVDELRDLDCRLGELANPLPEASDAFDEQAETRAAIETARTDLLADAIDTLDLAASGETHVLWRRFVQRRQWLKAEVS